MIIVNSDNASVNFDSVKKGSVFKSGGEIYEKSEIAFTDDDDTLNAIHLRTGELCFFGSFDKVEVFENARLVLSR